jgi:hypothetical protein
MLARLRRDSAWRTQWLTDHATDDACLVCARVEAAAGRWVRDWLEETHAEPGMVLRLRASLGFCARHTRAVLASGAEPTLLTLLFDRVVTRACVVLDQPGRYQRTACPLCERERREAESALTMLRGAIAGRGLPVSLPVCTDHTLAVMRTLPQRGAGARARLRTLADRLDERLLACLAMTDPVAVADTALRADPDARLRAEWATVRARLSEHHRGGVDLDPRERASRLMSVPACPVCVRAAVAEHDYLQWLLAQHAAQGRLERRESILCATHLHDLVPVSGRTGQMLPRNAHGVWSLLAANVRVWARRVTGFADGCVPGPTSRRRVRPLPELMAGLQRPAGCRACEAGAQAAGRASQLLHAVALDADLRAGLDRSHGVCFAHGQSLAPDDPLRLRLRARLAMTRWELDEAHHHTRWDQRFDPRGAERTGWSRAPTILDGAIYCGCPPRPLSSLP